MKINFISFFNGLLELIGRPKRSPSRKLPLLPKLPKLPKAPQLPVLPELPDLPDLPELPEFPELPDLLHSFSCLNVGMDSFTHLK